MTTSTVIPLSQRTAYQRWELDSFDDGAQAPHGAAQSAQSQALAASEQADRLRRQAQAEGFAAGHKQGREQATDELQRLQGVVQALTEEARRFDQSMAEELLALALALCKQIMREAIKVRPETILAVVNEVLGPSSLSGQRAHLILHPLDAALVREILGERLAQSGCQIIENAQISRGGCRLEAQEREIDATLERRWQRVVSAMGSEHAWIE